MIDKKRIKFYITNFYNLVSNKKTRVTRDTGDFNARTIITQKCDHSPLVTKLTIGDSTHSNDLHVMGIVNEIV